jgi:hypothetical protein
LFFTQTVVLFRRHFKICPGDRAKKRTGLRIARSHGRFTRFAAAQQSRTTGELEVAFDFLGAVTRKTLGFENGIHARRKQNLSFARLSFRRRGRCCPEEKPHGDNTLLKRGVHGSTLR